MKAAATPNPYGRTGGLRVIDGGRGRPRMLHVRASQIADLIDELTAAGMDMVAMADRLELVVTNRRTDLVPAIADRLRRLGQMYRDCAKPGGAA